MNKLDSISVLGSTGLVGSAIVRHLQKEGYKNLHPSSSKICNLLDPSSINLHWKTTDNHRYCFFSAAYVGGIFANINDPIGFGMINMRIILNTLQAAADHNVEKLLFLGSSCIYPKDISIPIKETDLLTGILEPTNETYALSKIIGLKLCQSYNKIGKNFISCMPCNIFGPGDTFHPDKSHVMAALIRKFHIAKEEKSAYVENYGTGDVRREHLYVDDVASACEFLMKNYEEKDSFINIGMGVDYSIREISEMVQEIVGFNGDVRWNSSFPSGMPRKLLDVSKMNKLGWTYKTSLREGIEKTYNWWLKEPK